MAADGSTRAEIGTLVVATSVIQLANGFFGTLVSLRVAAENFEASGIVLSAYFVGFTLGASRGGRIIERIGHIRAYAAFAGLVAAATVVMPLMIGAPAWTVLRALIGFGCAGIFVTTESWLTAKALPAEPQTMTARSSSRCKRASNAAFISRTICRLIALRASGRFSSNSAIPFSSRTLTVDMGTPAFYKRC